MSTPIFVCGYPKSGTTVLTALLDGHSQVVVFPEETAYLAKVRHQRDFTPAAGVKWLLEESTVKNLALGQGERLLDGNYDYSNIHFGIFQKCFLSKLRGNNLSHGQVLEALVAAYADEAGQSGKRYWLEKTPGNEGYLPIATQWYPDMYAIYIVRDPRDVYASYKRKKEIESDGHGTLSVERFICRWGMSIWYWQQYTGKHSRGLFIRYEDLLRYPKEIMGLICRFLDINYEDTLEIPTKNGVPWIGNSMYGDKFSGISTKPIGRWKQSLSEYHLTTIEAYLGKTMRSLNYQLSMPPLSLVQLFHYWRRQNLRRQIIKILVLLYWPFQLPQR